MGYNEFDPVFSLQKIETGWFIKPGVAYSCYFFLKNGLSHKILVLSLMGFCTGCCNLQVCGVRHFPRAKLIDVAKKDRNTLSHVPYNFEQNENDPFNILKSDG